MSSESITDRYAPFRVANDLLDDPPALRQALEDNGYLFFRGIGPRDKIINARKDVLRLCAQAGWIASPGDSLEAIWNGAGPFTEGDREYMDLYKQIIKLPSFLAVPEDRVFFDILQKIVDGPAMLHRLRIGRITFPSNTAQTTAAHQDHWYIRGSEQTYTVWTPLGDCPISLGGLAVLAGSHRSGFIEHRFDAAKKYAGHGLEPDQLPQHEWHAGDFALGDFILFHSLTVHKALANLTPDRLRFSTDNRYQREGDSISDISQKTHYNL
jgi:ectoine hydroxylase-related dioxygenase (phytanoyl-CoA dioxygenase family)